MELPCYNFEFSNSPAVREILSEAANEWNECKLPNADSIICALTEQQKLMVRSLMLPDDHLQKNKHALKARQYRMSIDGRHFRIFNRIEQTCDICSAIIGKNKNHFHFSSHKRLVDCMRTLPEGLLKCFPRADRHTVTGGNRTAFVLLDKVFGIEFLLIPSKQVNALNEKFERHIYYVITRITTIKDLTDILMAELAESAKAVDIMIVLEWGQVILHYIQLA